MPVFRHARPLLRHARPLPSCPASPVMPDHFTVMADLIGHLSSPTLHPFQDGNGRVGRLIMFKECLANGYVPFIITEELKMYYYRGLREWNNLRGYLLDTCLAAQDNYKAMLDYFKIRY